MKRKALWTAPFVIHKPASNNMLGGYYYGQKDYEMHGAEQKRYIRM